MIEFVSGIIFGSFLACAAFVGRMVYVNSRERWRKSVETPSNPVRFRQQTARPARPPEEQQARVSTARIRPVRRHL